MVGSNEDGGSAGIQRKSLQDEATDWLRREIVYGRLRPGSTVTEVSLSETMKIGRGTVRSALFAVEADELVERNPYSSWKVVPLDAAAIWEVYTLRGALEGLASRIVAEDPNPHRTKRIEDAFSALAPVEDSGVDTRVQADLGFHRAIVESTGHQHLIRRHRALAFKIEWLYRWSEEHWPQREPLGESHRQLYETIKRGTVADAEAAVRTHIEFYLQRDLDGLAALTQAS